MPDVTFALTKNKESALCLYSGCHCVYMPDVTLAKTNAMKLHCAHLSDVTVSICRKSRLLNKTTEVHCVYIRDAILSICRMSLVLNKTVEVHCVYIPDVIRLDAGCHFSLTNKQWKCIVSIFRMPFCLYAGCHFCLKLKQ